MNVSPKAEEILESLWIATEEKGENAAHFEILQIDQDDEALAELIAAVQEGGLTRIGLVTTSPAPK